MPSGCFAVYVVDSVIRQWEPVCLSAMQSGDKPRNPSQSVMQFVRLVVRGGRRINTVQLLAERAEEDAIDLGSSICSRDVAK